MDIRPPLSPRQRDCLKALERYTAEHGFPPSLRELAKALGIASTNGVHDHIKALERKGYIERDSGRARAIRVIKPDDLDDRARLWEIRARSMGWTEESEAAE